MTKFDPQLKKRIAGDTGTVNIGTRITSGVRKHKNRGLVILAVVILAIIASKYMVF